MGPDILHGKVGVDGAEVAGDGEKVQAPDVKQVDQDARVQQEIGELRHSVAALLDRAVEPRLGDQIPDLCGGHPDE